MELIKEIYGKLDSRGGKERWGVFLCGHCNSKKETRIRDGLAAKSCGCKGGIYKHGYCENGESKRLYKIWSSMKNRCFSKASKRYNRYGARGITVCDEWLEFKPFMEWANANGYSDNLQIDRINNDGNYDPSNCRFVTLANNNRNKANTKLSFEKAGEIRSMYKEGHYSQRKLASIFDVPQGTVWKVLKNKAWC